MGVTKRTVSGALDEANIEHVKRWGDGHSFSANLNQIISEHRYLTGMGIVARDLRSWQVICPLSAPDPKAESEDAA